VFSSKSQGEGIKGGQPRNGFNFHYAYDSPPNCKFCHYNHSYFLGAIFNVISNGCLGSGGPALKQLCEDGVYLAQTDNEDSKHFLTKLKVLSS